MTQPPVEGELLPAVRAPTEPVSTHGPTHRHGVCHREFRSTFAPWIALCGAVVHHAGDLRRQDLQKCPECLAASADHALHCDCWKLFPQARLPR